MSTEVQQQLPEMHRFFPGLLSIPLTSFFWVPTEILDSNSSKCKTARIPYRRAQVIMKSDTQDSQRTDEETWPLTMGIRARWNGLKTFRLLCSSSSPSKIIMKLSHCVGTVALQYELYKICLPSKWVFQNPYTTHAVHLTQVSTDKWTCFHLKLLSSMMTHLAHNK